MKPKKIVIIGGGKGTAMVARSIKDDGVFISIIHTPADDGGSGGDMRRAFGMIAPGDARGGLLALSESRDKKLLDFFAHRYATGPLKGQVVGNLMLAGLTQMHGNFEKAIAIMKKLLLVHGDIIPASLQLPTLYARLENNKIIKGEMNIYSAKYNPRLHIKKAWLEPKVALNPKAKLAIAKADLIIIGPGSLYSSIIPNLLVTGMPQALRRTRAEVVYIINSVNQAGQTIGFKPEDYIKAVELYLGEGVIDAAIVQDAQLTPALKKFF